MYGTLTLTLPTTSKPINFQPESRIPGRTSRFPARASVRAFSESATIDRGCVKSGSSLYEILKVKRNATVTEIKTAYRSLAKMYHPDLSGPDGSDGSDFIEIHNAYATLSDPAARAVYDLSIGLGAGHRRRRDFGFYPTRRWETDQCW